VIIHRRWTDDMRAVPTHHSALEMAAPLPRYRNKIFFTTSLSDRRLDRETRLADLHGNFQLASSLDRQHACGLETPTRARKVRSIAEKSSQNTLHGHTAGEES